MKLLKILLVSFLMAAILLPGISLAGDDYMYPLDPKILSAEGKIDDGVLEGLGENEIIEVLVKMKDRESPSSVAEQAARKVAPGTNAEIRNLYIRQQVIDALKNRAEISQKSVLQFLTNKKRQGKVREVKSYYIVNMIYIEADEETIRQLAQRPDIENVIPNEKVELQVLPSVETKEIELSGSSSVEWNIQKIGAPLVWGSLGVSGEGIVVATIDSGVDWEHDSLKTRWRGYDPENPESPDPVFNWLDLIDDEQAIPYDDIGHGTHVMGIILGFDEPADKIVGAAPGAQWIAVRVFKNNTGKASDLLEAGEYLLAPTDEHGVPHPGKAPHIINNSWGGEGLNDWYQEMVESWRSAGIFPVFAAGNTGPEEGSINNPGHLIQSFAVGATDSSDGLASFSSRGPGPYPVIKPDLSAPGVNIRSSKVGGGYSLSSGTSMAAPHVAGTAALVLSLNPMLTVDQLETVLKNTALSLTSESYPETPNHGYGFGRVDAYGAALWLEENTCGYISGKVQIPAHEEPYPAQARVTVLETGRKSVTNPEDGTFTLIHPATSPGEKWTLRIEAEGYHLQEKQLELDVQGYWQDEFLLSPEFPVTGITMDKEEIEVSLRIGGELTAQVIPENASNQKILWSSSNEEILTVTEGRITPMASGEATVTAISQEGGFHEDCQVTVFSLDRVYGSNRYQTAVEISREGWESADTVIIARGDEYADALAGVPLTFYLDAPILLTPTSALSSYTRGEIQRLEAKKVVILGGLGAVSMVVEDELTDMGLEIERISGNNRFDTAAEIALRLAPEGVDTAVVAYGYNFPDALAAASYAAVRGYPILLTRSDSVPSQILNTIQVLGIENTVVAGGPGVISNEVLSQLPPNTNRVYGDNRYETASALAEYFTDSVSGMFVATGLDFPDAIAGAGLAARYQNGILLVHGEGTQNQVHSSVEQFIQQNNVSWITVFGGTGAVNLAAEDRLRELLFGGE